MDIPATATNPAPSFIPFEFKDVGFMVMLWLWLVSGAQGFEAFIIANNPCLIDPLSSGDGKELDQFCRGELFHLVMKCPRLLGQKRSEVGQSSPAEGNAGWFVRL